MLAALGDVVRSATAALDAYDHAGALEATERFFWMFCDDYLELVKARAYGSGAGASSARGALRTALSVLLRLFAPFLPFVTEEVWSWWQEGSVHRASWPLASVSGGVDAPPVLATAAAVLSQIRKAKSEAKVSMRAEAARVVVRGPADAADAVRVSEDDLRAAGNVADFSFVLVPGGELATEVTLAEPVTS
jgi:valyl-tRNA synthetase